MWFTQTRICKTTLLVYLKQFFHKKIIFLFKLLWSAILIDLRILIILLTVYYVISKNRVLILFGIN